ncbi:S-layer homology domain-containing protein [Metasolibacillus meyeri]|uniref:S-layer homology domain-containing protein n=1 Tax=Metasolibacillus meyeri TaxID=1071052 RepID=A0AAW9NQL0_9BACL|nr:S-layer homology domain-containing protein [Metasolibacillus meyeri]MEC1177579.1 S-layer homology domain-containing protein [Metasolibacillus meyeri]
MKQRQWLVTIVSLLLFAVVFSSGKANASTIDLNGGVKNENTYEEYIFLTGVPIKFTGTNKNVVVSVAEKKGQLTETYKLTLTGASGEKLTRQFTYVYDVTNYDQIGQSTATGEVTKYTEKITIGNKTYTLTDYQFSKSAITDKRPASDYFSGNAMARKTYSVKSGRNTDEVTIHIDSRNEGYENFWGATETQITEYEMVFEDGSIGTVKNRVSSSKSRTLNYEENASSLSSFYGGYVVNSTADIISEYDYKLPKKSGTVSLNLKMMPRIERLIVPKFRDLSSHQAKDAIEKLYSLGILEDQSNFFSPNTPMQRYDFTVAIGKAIDLRVLEESTKGKKTPPSIFNDVKRTTKDYGYLASAVNKGVVTGVTPSSFDPHGYLTRQQAAAILVRALGLEGKAPDPGFKTNYRDDAQITDYARDAVYVVSELGLMTGDSVTGNFNPKQNLTRAQASLIMLRFLEYLENDLKQNYRDDILFFD